MPLLITTQIPVHIYPWTRQLFNMCIWKQVLVGDIEEKRGGGIRLEQLTVATFYCMMSRAPDIYFHALNFCCNPGGKFFRKQMGYCFGTSNSYPPLLLCPSSEVLFRWGGKKHRSVTVFAPIL